MKKFAAKALLFSILCSGIIITAFAPALGDEGHSTDGDTGASEGTLGDEVEAGEEIPFAPPRLIPIEEEEVGKPREPSFTFHGRQRTWVDTYERPAGEGRGSGLYNQSRLAGEGRFGDFRLHAEIDLFAGRIVGNYPGTPLPAVADHGARPFHPIGSELTTLVDPRQAYLEWMSTVGMLRLGLQSSSWGKGILANGGHDSRYIFSAPFGGDRSLRALFATAPLRSLSSRGWWDDLFIAVGADLVYRDENANLIEGDQALQVLGSLLYDPDDTSLGAYIAYRSQEDRDGSLLNVTALDLYADQSWNFVGPGRGFHLLARAEAAYLFGETTRADAPRAAGPIDVAAFGIAGLLEADHHPSGLGVQFRTGFASGDANPRSPSLHRFRFDPNYQVGMLLFDHHIPAWTRNSVEDAEDELRLRDTPRGIENLIESGSVSNTIYFHPTMTGELTNNLTLAVGFLTAYSHRRLRDLLATFEAGGDVVGPAGAPDPGNHLGFEVQAGLRYARLIGDRLIVEGRAEGALLRPGDAFNDANGEPDPSTTLLRAFLTLSW